jgi:hypothetical protein
VDTGNGGGDRVEDARAAVQGRLASAGRRG